MADLARALMSGFFGGDASQWERALLMPHYSAAGMPACSLHQVCVCGGGGGDCQWVQGWIQWGVRYRCFAIAQQGCQLAA
jgi:hypothetical protein